MGSAESVTKAGRTFAVLSRGKGRVAKRCRCASCRNAPIYERWDLLPCECHSTMIRCTCPLRETICNRCGRVFMPVEREWVEIEDPHEGGGDG